MAEEDRLAVAPLDELRRDGAVEGPDVERRLGGKVRMELQRNRRLRVDSRVEMRRHLRVVDAVRRGPFLRGDDGDLRRARGEFLVRPDGPGRAALDGTGIAGGDSFQRRVQ